MTTIPDLRTIFSHKLAVRDFVTDRSGSRMLEIINASFLVDEPEIFGRTSWDYVGREIEWYESQSLEVKDIPGGPPKIWERVASKQGFINSNYGWMIYSEKNGSQFENVVLELKRNVNSRRAVMIYTRPSMWKDYDRDGMSDFCCTNSVQYLIRDGLLHCVVQMRSNDALYGFKNDKAWQDHVLNKLCERLREETYPDLEVGTTWWNAGSLHVYERHFFLVDHYDLTLETAIDPADYAELYPSSEWNPRKVVVA